MKAAVPIQEPRDARRSDCPCRRQSPTGSSMGRPGPPLRAVLGALALLALLPTETRAFGGALPRVGLTRGGCLADRRGGWDLGARGRVDAAAPPSPSSWYRRCRGGVEARLFPFSLVRKISRGVRHSLLSLRGERGRSSDSMVPHDDLIYRRRGPDRELTSIPQPERYTAGDWIHNIINLPGSQVLRRIRGPILLNMVWAFIVSVLFRYLNLQPIPGRVHTLLGSSLGLLLVFRTNASYARYWEGRGLWEKLQNKSRDLARAVSLYEDCIGADRVTTAGRLICAYPLILREHLTGENHKPELSRLLGQQLSDTMDCSTNKPMWLCNRLSLIFRAIPESKHFSSRERLMLLALVNDLGSVAGACERLVQTPVPLSYARHTSRFLTLYLWSLPMVLYADFSGPLLSLITGFVSWCLFGILEIGLLIEDPFAPILRSSWTTVIADGVIRDVQWNIAENRALAASSSAPPYPAAAAAPGPAA